MTVDLLLGLQWGDEGKGKIVDVLTSKYDIIARFQGGPNAGHTLEFDGIKHVLRTIPSGIFHKNSINIIGNGVVIDPVVFQKELEGLAKFDIDIQSRLIISRKAHLILPTHRLLDAASEASKGKAKIGSTLKGIGPTYMDKTGRNGLRVGDIELADFKERYRALADKHEAMIAFYDVDLQYDLKELEDEFFESIEVLKTLQFIDSEEYINKAMKEGKSILAEGAQGSLLDIDFGTYPFVTSSNTTAAGACTGLGIAPNRVKEVFGIFKAYTTRVGSGPFPTELFDKDGETMAKVGNEFGSVTGRARRCGWLDLVALKYAIQVNGVTALYMMKGDVLSGFDTLKICTAYNYKGTEIDHLPYNIEPENVSPVYVEKKGWKADLTGMTTYNELPSELKEYVEFIENFVEVPIKVISVGPDRKQTILK
ncbi:MULTISPECIES: adenylosuccinate synthase [Flavobacterium]|jgi:adenylosuccinate synthase|uniref:Adenylosuccinate synthetase n=1 Tax=Flavobacterium lindanitolerans TaxID=428988 RepID=A0A497U5Z9_9FLAO|nr:MULTISPECIES: adenylosuccinate synthase [Flavobacterium]MBU7569855.1 adenylosuccinate synthase [Flavobacterium sp.]PZQ81079.1 MAG: adenylosuccinate synthase [Flavobacterium johnsoniae]KQS46198.1 adenylosuccinate synthetase [Flavobacterium sp. Leaf359]MBL7868202.1 adenylosuccinate synthase [Flavobacterium lindanitolerans]MDQ7961688.1 adenylosuccinate synthase [Flavobacterium lindanitolerans]